ncbi:hypothetical protein MPTK1_1g14840 [Marchantia polymorpha subsp. ruderalis]|uniref:Citrate transporter-like domain-containing protein n=2 Tax=Marchantia polymorpha TaxID=3197 RepID=A0AAF6AQ94_MARPO|nr:hypothetical protein MARPO_0153s0006 [Marchantia polymorpha]BBM98614.1 hypothetical protein Mp_1g14840 [Marchantia polymorpha subsp. ruderalis]|eukprot:PTQ28835.1 hypothetical protein MARPO_0153s0006 [Marchantia polymorpha]
MAWAEPWKVVLGCVAFTIWWILAVFPAVPWLPIGRTAGSLLGAVLMVVCQIVSPDEAFKAIDLPILALLFGTMVLSVYLERANLFKYLGNVLAWKSRGGKDLLCRVCILSGLCSAFFTNDTTCVVLTDFVLKMCKKQKLPMLPFLMALASSANIGSAATAIGNPQNLVIAVQSGISFGKFMRGILPAVVVGIAANIVLLLLFYWKSLSAPQPDVEEGNGPGADHSLGEDKSVKELSSVAPLETLSENRPEPSARASFEAAGAEVRGPHVLGHASPNAGRELHERRHGLQAPSLAESPEPPPAALEIATGMTGVTAREAVSLRNPKSLLSRRVRTRLWTSSVYLVTVGFLAALLAGLNLSWCAVTAAVVLMILDFSDAGPSLEKVSYSLLIFFSGMFIAVEGFNNTGAPGALWDAVEPHSRIENVKGLTILALVVILLSNVASNVPTVLLLGARVAASAASANPANVTKAWLILAWVSTVAGNLTLLGSAANLIVSEQARTADNAFNFSFLKHLPFGLPSTLIVVAVGLPLVRGG